MGRPSKSEQQARRAAAAAEAAAEAADATSSKDQPAEGVCQNLAVTPNRIDGAGQTAPLFDPLLSIDQVSEWLGKPKNTLYAWKTRGLGPTPIKVGNSLRYRRSDVDAYLDANTLWASSV